MRKSNTAYNKFPKHIGVIGDSLSSSFNYSARLWEYWPYLLDTQLAAAGCFARTKTCAISGTTTGMMYSRIPAMLRNGEPPEIAIIFAGVNDPLVYGTVEASPAPTDTVFTVSSTHGNRFRAGTYINVNDTSCNAGTAARKILSVVGDVITLETALPSALTAGDIIRNDTYKNIELMSNYLTSIGCTKQMLVGAQYLNYTTGGDTVSTPYAPYATLRAAQAAVATAKGMVFVDIYASLKARIVGGQTTQGEWTAWHVLDANQHFNAAGQALVGGYIYAAIQAQTGWIAAIS